MASCIHFNLDGTYAIWEMNVYQEDGQQVDNCGDELLVTKSEYYDLVNGLGVGDPSPLSITPEQGAEIASAILVIWALAYVIRVVIRALNVDEKGDST